MSIDPDTGLRPIPAWLLAAALAAIILLSTALPGDAQDKKPATPLPRAVHGIELGMDRDAVIAALKKESLFLYRGPEDVSLLPSPNQSLIDVAGPSFVKHAYFQFLDNKLWVMILVLNPDRIDHYSIYTSLVAKYGEPNSLDPKESRWEDGAVRMALERPLTLRYMDLAVYSKLKEGSAAQGSAVEIDRQDFLGQL
ncbi:MAG TPA: hypothetical protein VFL04_01130 [Rectinemataceae bacterium]|nr:hypothetical protein [Rectinemataceae bacterium]